MPSIKIRPNPSLIILVVIFVTGCSFGNTPTPLNSTTTPKPATITATTPPPVPTATEEPTATKPAVLNDAPTMTATPAPTATTEPAFSRQSDTLALPVPASPAPIRKTPGIPCTVNAAALNLREGPGINYRLMKTLASNESVSALKCAPGGSWLLVETTQNEIGWLDARFLNCQDNIVNLPVAQGVVVQAPLSVSTTPGPQPIRETTTPLNLPSPTPTRSLDVWRGEYYDNASLLGEPVLIREDPELDFNWILDSPAPGIPADNFSVRWTRLFDFFESGDYRFFAEVDDGIRLYVDGWLVIDAWHTFIPVRYQGDFADIQAGIHTVTVEYFESGGHAKIKVWAEKTHFADPEWQGQYYANPDLQDPVFLSRQDQTIDFDWGHDPPASGMDGNNFSVRWRRDIFFDPGDYKFFAEIADKDGVKIYLDGWLVVDEYRKDGGTVSGSFGNLGAGFHEVTVEYYDDTGRAKIKVWWERL